MYFLVESTQLNGVLSFTRTGVLNRISQIGLGVDPIVHNRVQSRVIYQANPSTAQTLRRVRDNAYQASMRGLNQHVRIQTVDGQVYEGVIVNVDRNHVYLRVPGMQGYGRQWDEDLILTLVLYELLVITLMYI